MKNTRILRTVTVYMLIFSLLLSFASDTFAWFGGENSVRISESGGAVLTQYFHCGTGTESDPYVITRPVHYYNLVMLYQANPSSFVDKGLYFQLGYDLDNDGDLEVYDYDNSGVTDGKTYSASLNMASFTDGVLPVGTAVMPFGATFDGSGLTISNIKVVGSCTLNGTTYKTPDIGLFGYVDDSASISNLYVDGLTIDLTDVDGSATYQTSGRTSMTHTDHTGTAYVGYLCGHIKNYYDDHSSTNTQASGTASPFTNVYLNNCTIVGGDNTTRSTTADEYGYYGHVDNQNGALADTISALEKQKGEGDDYSFIFNAADVYSFLGTLDTSKTLITRNWNESGYGSKLSNAISKSSSYYQLVGHSPDTSSVSYDYSFDTIGYSGGNVYYDLYYKNGTYTSLPTTVTLTDTDPATSLTTTGQFIYNAGTNYKYVEIQENYYTVYYYDGTNYQNLTESAITVTQTPPTTQTAANAFFYYDEANKQWYYYSVTTPYSDGTSDAYYPLYYKDGSTYTRIASTVTLSSELPADCDTVGAAYLYYSGGQWNYSVCTTASVPAPTFSVTFQGSGSFSVSKSVDQAYSLSSTSLNTNTATGTLYVDGVNKGDIKVNLTVSGGLSNTTFTGTITATSDSVTVSGLTSGTHKYAVIVNLSDITCTFSYRRRSTSLQDRTTDVTFSGCIYSGTVSNTTLSQNTSAALSATNNSVNMKLSYSSSRLTYSDTTTGDFATSTDAVFTTYPVYYNSGVYYSAAGNGTTESTWQLYTSNETLYDSNNYKCRKGSISSSPTASVYTQYPISYGDSHTNLTSASITLHYKDGEWKNMIIAKGAGPYDVYYKNGTEYTLLTSAPTSYNGVYKYLATGDTYISDAFHDYVSYTDSDGNEWRYNSDNIDIVGGLQFYSDYVYMNGYAKNTTTLTNSYLGTKFYGHSTCPDSILLYIKNVQGLKDTDSMGTITAYYDKYDGNNTPADSMRLNRYKMSSDSDTSASRGFSTSLGCSTVTKTIDGTSRTGYSATLTKSIIEQVAYCGIDADGNIVCIPSTSSLSMTYASGKTSSDVAYYVLFLGVSSGHLKTYEIDFEFKAQRGVGTQDVLKQLTSEEPVFRYVDYRDASATVGTSLINMSWTLPSGATSSNFSVNVDYGTSTVTIGSNAYHYYVITVNNTTGNSMNLSVVLYDDDSNADNAYYYVYQIVYNGSVVQNTSYTTDSSTQNYWQVSHTHTLS